MLHLPSGQQVHGFADILLVDPEHPGIFGQTTAGRGLQQALLLVHNGHGAALPFEKRLEGHTQPRAQKHRHPAGRRLPDQAFFLFRASATPKMPDAARGQAETEVFKVAK